MGQRYANFPTNEEDVEEEDGDDVIGPSSDEGGLEEEDGEREDGEIVIDISSDEEEELEEVDVNATTIIITQNIYISLNKNYIMRIPKAIGYS